MAMQIGGLLNVKHSSRLPGRFSPRGKGAAACVLPALPSSNPSSMPPAPSPPSPCPARTLSRSPTSGSLFTLAAMATCVVEQVSTRAR